MAKCRRDIDGDDCQPGDPTPEEIARLCLKIQNEGFLDYSGEFQPPWDAATRRARRLQSPGDFRKGRPDEEHVEPASVKWSDINAAADAA